MRAYDLSASEPVDMGVTIDVADGQIDREDTKDITVSAEDAGGDLVTLQSIDLTLEVGEQKTTYSLADFDADAKKYRLEHTFIGSGFAEIDCTVTDMSGSQERVTDDFIVLN